MSKWELGFGTGTEGPGFCGSCKSLRASLGPHLVLRDSSVTSEGRSHPGGSVRAQAGLTGSPGYAN